MQKLGEVTTKLNRQKQERRAQTAVDRQALRRLERAIAGIIAAIEIQRGADRRLAAAASWPDARAAA